MRQARTLVVMLGLLATAGCTSLRGSAEPVIPVRDRVNYVATYPEDTVYKTFFALKDNCSNGERPPVCRDGLTRVQYRNMITALYMSAADARYEEFRTRLSQEAKGTAFGGNIAILLMNGISVVSGNEARRALAAGSAVVAGGQASVSKDLFIDKALSAVLASMDGARAEAKTRIVEKLRLSAEQYSLPEALADVRRVEEQARLDQAIQKLTSTAVADAEEKQKKLDVAYMVELQGPLATRKSALLDDIEALSDDDFDKAIKAIADPNLDAAIKSVDSVPDNEKRKAKNARIRVWVHQNILANGAFDETVRKLAPITKKDSY